MKKIYESPYICIMQIETQKMIVVSGEIHEETVNNQDEILQSRGGSDWDE